MQKLDLESFISLISGATGSSAGNVELVVADGKRSAYVDVFDDGRAGRLTFSLDGYLDVEVLGDNAETLRWEHFDRGVTLELLQSKYAELVREVFGR